MVRGNILDLITKWSRNYNQYFLGGTELTIQILSREPRWLIRSCLKNVGRFSIFILPAQTRPVSMTIWCITLSLYEYISRWNSIWRLETLPDQIGLIYINWDRTLLSLPLSSILSLRSSPTSSPSDNGELNVCYNPINNSQPLIGKPIRRETFYFQICTGRLSRALVCVSIM